MSGAPLKILEKKYEIEKRRRRNLSFAAFISESAIIELERQDMLKDGQFVGLVAFQDDTVILKDVRRGERFIEVQIRDRTLKCLYDDKFDCIHVGFSLALPEVRNVLVRG